MLHSHLPDALLDIVVHESYHIYTNNGVISTPPSKRSTVSSISLRLLFMHMRALMTCGRCMKYAVVLASDYLTCYVYA